MKAYNFFDRVFLLGLEKQDGKDTNRSDKGIVSIIVEIMENKCLTKTQYKYFYLLNIQ